MYLILWKIQTTFWVTLIDMCSRIMFTGYGSKYFHQYSSILLTSTLSNQYLKFTADLPHKMIEMLLDFNIAFRSSQAPTCFCSLIRQNIEYCLNVILFRVRPALLVSYNRSETTNYCNMLFWFLGLWTYRITYYLYNTLDTLVYSIQLLSDNVD